MPLSKNQLYSLLFIVCLAGYIWLFFSLNKTSGLPISNLGISTGCIIKKVTTIPCPSCGATRSVISILKGNFTNALMLNPLGYIVALIMFLAPIWILIDLLLKKESLYKSYHTIEVYFRKPLYAIPLATLIIINWIWNITKGL